LELREEQRVELPELRKMVQSVEFFPKVDAIQRLVKGLVLSLTEQDGELFRALKAARETRTRMKKGVMRRRPLGGVQ
jgi:hypothetical protein